jgi:hypothetical protein
MRVACSKPDAAVRQIDVAIVLLLTDGDPLAIRTLAGAAYGIFADLAEYQKKGSSWRTKIFKDSGLSEKEGKRVLNDAQSYLKHANMDPHSSLAFEEEENDHLIFIASIECGGIEHPLSYPMQAFQIWYLALYPEKIGHETQPVTTAKQVFPDLSKKERREQLVFGHQFLERVLEHKGPI